VAEEEEREGGGNHTHHRPGARLDGMAGQCLCGQPEAAWGSLHRSGNGGTRSNPIWAASTHTCIATTRSTAAQPPHFHLREAVGDRKRPARFWARWQQGGGSPSGVKPRISSVRRRPANLLGRGERGSRVERFALGGGGGTRRSRPESLGNGGGDLGFVGVSREERGARSRQVWVGLTDPGPGRLG
jgi:hypothetical protein